MGDASRGLVAGVVSTILYALLIAAIALTQQCPPPSIAAVTDKAPQDTYAQLKAIREKVELPKPPPPPPPPVEEVKPEEPPKAETPRPKRKRKKKPRRTQPKAEAPPVATAEPAPLVLENAGLTGGVNVQKGARDIFGDPSVAANDTNTRPQPVVVEEDPVIIGAKPTRASRALRGIYPDDAPRTGRVVSVVLKIAVDSEGKPISVKVLRSAGSAFDKEARKIGRRLRFKPASRNGEPIPWTVRWTVDFDPNL